MAENTKRETIITGIETLLKSCSEVRTVERKHPTFEDVKNYAPTQFPVVSLVGGLPVPRTDNQYGGKPGKAGPIRSDMPVTLQFVANVGKDYDEWISFYLDEIWRCIHADMTLGGQNWITEYRANPDENAGIEPPYIAFFVTITITYLHDTTGV